MPDPQPLPQPAAAFFVGTAWAGDAAPAPTGGDAAGGGPAGGFGSTAILLVAVFAIFYFLLIRPQQKEAKEHQSLLSSLQKGDRVVTSAGIHGRVAEIRDAEVVLEVAEKVRITVDKPTVKRKLAAQPDAGRSA